MKADPQQRRELLQARCAAQRLLLSQRTAEVVRRLRSTDAALGVTRNVLGKSAAAAGTAALFWAARRGGWSGLITRGLALVSAGRQLSRLLRRR